MDIRQMRDTSQLFGANAPFVEMLFDRYLADPDSVPGEWRDYFAHSAPNAHGREVSHAAIIGEIAARAKSGAAVGAVAADAVIAAEGKQSAVDRLIGNYRNLGSRIAAINPLYDDPAPIASLLPATLGLTAADEDAEFNSDIAGLGRAPLREIVRRLREVYCGHFAAEFMHITADAERLWVQSLMETRARLVFDPATRRRLLEKTVAAEALERFLHTRYVGQKRFSLEGGDALIPVMDDLLRRAGAAGVVEAVIGMAHRGRLNVLINILGKSPRDLIDEFEGRHEEKGGSGDVKYHLGFSSSLTTPGGKMHLALAFNPSHLEIVNPVVEGSVRARQDRRGDAARKSVLPILIHGDAAFAGQGVVMETLNLSQTRGFKTGGTVHIIINNQIGFTTSTPDDARSTFFCSDVAKMIETPIFHARGDNPEAAAAAARAAFDYRQKFGRDAVVDLVCYRRHGHNEQDEPMVTQPLMYRKVARQKGAGAVFAARLQAEGAIAEGAADEIAAAYKKRLEAGKSANPDAAAANASVFVDWSEFNLKSSQWDFHPAAADRASRKELRALGEKLSTLPKDFVAHNRLKKILEARAQMAKGKIPLDWGMAENLAYATLLEKGYPVRLSGQDCGRGTFFHRHAVWHDQNRSRRDGGNYVPLRDLSETQAPFLVIDSILSEEAVLGFEYGYATTAPGTLVLWEAQFGDFANGAQVVVDQFIAAGETKWRRYCGLVLLLPHGYEGQGPEHSSARLERYLQLCAEYNMQVCVPSNAAQIYHLLRRQMFRPSRRPLVVITPKSLLRNKEAASDLGDLADGRFAPIIGETDPAIKKVERAVFCAGKIYYELRAARKARGIDNIALIRLEQLYPFPHEHFKAQLAKYKNAAHIVWCQEEPGNQGAWHRIQHYLRRPLLKGQRLTYALRPSAASPAAGYHDLHARQQREVIDAALDVHSVV